MKYMKLMLVFCLVVFPSIIALAGEQEQLNVMLMTAAENGKVGVVKEALAKGAEVNTAQDNGVTPLFVAAQKGDLEIVKVLLAAGANANAARIDGITPLYMASGGGHIRIVRALLAARADANAAATNGATPLMIASYEGHEIIVKLLLAAGADVNATTHSDGKIYSALRYALEQRQDLVIRVLRQYGAKRLPQHPR